MRPIGWMWMRAGTAAGTSALFAWPTLWCPALLNPLTIAALGAIAVPVMVASAQQARAVSTDESVKAQDALIRVRELNAAGNGGEAMRVLQLLLTEDGDRLLPDASDEMLFVPVRAVIHSMLMADAAALDRYRQEQEPAAADLLASGRLDEAERTRLLTPSGFEAALRLTQLEAEAGRFESARLILNQLELHPDRRTPQGRAGAAAMATLVAACLPRTDQLERAARWAKESGAEPAAQATIEVGAELGAGISPFLSPHAALPPKIALDRPLQSVALDPLRRGITDDSMSVSVGVSWVLPTVLGERVFINDGVGVAAFDAATLSPIWTARPSDGVSRQVPNRGMVSFAMSNTGIPDEPSTVSAGWGVLVAATGIPDNGGRRGDTRVHGLDEATGQILWSIEPSRLDPQLDGAFVRGSILIDSGVAVIALRKPTLSRRVAALYLVGVDLRTGALRWVRMVGSTGTNPWGRWQGRSDSGLMHEGIVYRADDMGVLGAYEAARGRPIWVRLSPNTRSFDQAIYRLPPPMPPWESSVPVVIGPWLFSIEPGTGRTMQIDREDGAMLARRSRSELGDPRYLLASGTRLVAVGESRLATLDAETFASSEIALSRNFGEGAPSGRAIVAGAGENARILWPMVEGLAVIPPGQPSIESRMQMTSPGNIVIAPDTGATEPVVLSAGSDRLQTMLSWDAAGRLLDARMAKRSDDPAPLLTALELFHKVGQTSRAPALADRLLELAAKRPEASLDIRARLLERLLAIVAESQNTRSDTDGGAERTGPTLPLLDEILDRAARSTDTVAGQARVLLDRAWLREAQARPAEAVEALQEILADPTAAATELALDMSADGPRTSAAGLEATRRLSDLLTRLGVAPYAPFDEEARLQLEALDADRASGAALATLARRYPVADVAAEAWGSAGEAFDREGSADEARLAFGRGLAAAELGMAIGRGDQAQTLSRLAAAVISRSRERGELEPIHRLLRRLAMSAQGTLATSTPGAINAATMIEVDGVPRGASELAAEIARTLATRSWMPRVGTALSGRTQVIEGFEVAEPIDRTSPGLSRDSVAMISEARGELSLFAVSAYDDRLAPLWSRPFRFRPSVVRIAPEATIVFWPTPGGGWLEAISPEGATLWKSGELSSVLAVANAAQAGVGVNTPLDGAAGLDDVVITSDPQSVLIGRRSGGVLCFDTASGALRFSVARALSRVYDIALAQGGRAIISGAAISREEGQERLVAALLCLAPDGTTGARLGPDELGDHARWVVPIRGEGDVLVGTASGILRLDPSSGTVRWKTDGANLQGSIAATVVGSGGGGGVAFVLESSSMQLWRVDLRSGDVDDEPGDTRQRLTLPVSLVPVGGALTLTTSLGLIVIDESGQTIGADGIDAAGRIEPPVLAEGLAIAVEASGRETQAGESSSKIYFIELPSGRLQSVANVMLMDAPRLPMVIEGKILISQGPVTLVFDAPAK